MLTITDKTAGQRVTCERDAVADSIRDWFPGMPPVVNDTVVKLQDALNRGDDSETYYLAVALGILVEHAPTVIDPATMADRVARGAAWLADQGYAITEIDPDTVNVRLVDSCPAGQTVGYDWARHWFADRNLDATYREVSQWCVDHGFLCCADAHTSIDPCDAVIDAINAAWRTAINAARPVDGPARPGRGGAVV